MPKDLPARTAATVISTTAASAAVVVFTRVGFVDGQCASVNFLAVERRDGVLSFFFARHFDEMEKDERINIDSLIKFRKILVTQKSIDKKNLEKFMNEIYLVKALSSKDD